MLFSCARAVRLVGTFVFVLGLVLGPASATYAQIAQQSQGVGGILISPQGALSNAGVEVTNQLREFRLKLLQQIPAEMNRSCALRKVSLRGLEAAIVEHLDGRKPLSDTMRLLAGLQQIQYVLVYPEKQDIVLVGPAEGWKVDARGNVVGVTTGRPVLLLDDLLVALRTGEQAIRGGGLSCSIDPTSEGLSRLQRLAAKLHTVGNPQETATGIEQALGPQKISINGVPGTSHFARVMVAADYRMKRIAMDFEPSPVRSLPSFLRMMPATKTGMSNMLPRWWLAAEYEPVVRDAEGLAWEIGGARVKAMTEEDFVAADGTRQQTGKANPVAQKWADLMTAHYDELALADPIFGQLRSCMELAVVGALIVKERLAEKAGYSLPLLLDASRLEIDKFPAPQQVASQASIVKKGRNTVFSASGGVLIEPQGDAPAAVRAKSAPAGKTWWWD